MINFKKTSIVIAVVLIISVLTGCSANLEGRVESVQLNENGDLVINYSDGSSKEVNSVETSKAEETSIVKATSQGLRSSVSVICGFGKINTPSAYYSAGSGVIIELDRENGNALIVTNYHVVYDVNYGICEGIAVYLYGSEYADSQITATYVGGSMNYDIAVLYVENSDIIKNSSVCAVEIADSDLVSVGQTAIAIGNAEGYGISASNGIVSVDSEYIDMLTSDDSALISFRVMRIDTAVNHGNSGGGLFNAQGQLIGIVNAKIISDDVENIGYAIPSSLAIAVARNIIDNCFEKECSTLQRCMLGITIKTATSSAKYDEGTGLVQIVESVEVVEVSRGSIAYGVIESGDVLVSATLNGVTKEITRQFHVIDFMLNARAGDTVYFTVLRDGERLELSFEITEDCVTSY